MRKNRRKKKINKENIYKFVVDKENKPLILTFLCFLGMLVIFTIISNLWIKIGIYYLFYMIVVKCYDKAVNLIFRDILKQ